MTSKWASCSLILILFHAGHSRAQAPVIEVGANVEVSTAHEKYSLGEATISANPVDENRLLACAVVYASDENRRWTVGYLSTDRGRNWTPTLETGTLDDSSDEWCTFGPEGEGWFTAIGVTSQRAPRQRVLGIFKSEDNGRTWHESEVPLGSQHLDRQSIVIDATAGKYRGTLYISGTSRSQYLQGRALASSFGVWRLGRGETVVLGPLTRLASEGHMVLVPSNMVVLRNGTVVGLYADVRTDGTSVAPSTAQQPNAVLKAILLDHGGEVMSEAVRVDDMFLAWPSGYKRLGTTTHSQPSLAVDASDGPFTDRLYATWADLRDGRSEVRFSYSVDRGRTWSTSAVIDDIASVTGASATPDNFLPVVAVNKDGVVLVTWYDRRDNPDGLGWFLRARASLDGGETWLPSIRVSEKPNIFDSRHSLSSVAYVTPNSAPANFEGAPGEAVAEVDDSGAGNVGGHVGKAKNLSLIVQGREFFAGDYAGLAADAGGIFHASWVDDRTSRAQVWTASIRVHGHAVLNGDAALASLRDVTDEAAIKTVSSKVDPTTGDAEIGIQITNLSAAPFPAPVKIRLLGVTSWLGVPSVVDAANQIKGPGAVWDVPLASQAALASHEHSNVVLLKFHLDKTRPFIEDKFTIYRALDVSLRVLAATK